MQFKPGDKIRGNHWDKGWEFTIKEIKFTSYVGILTNKYNEHRNDNKMYPINISSFWEYVDKQNIVTHLPEFL